MYAFTYHRPETLAAAVDLASSAEEAKLLAGGQTLLPTMKQRLAAPAHIIDLGRLADLRYIRVTDCERRDRRADAAFHGRDVGRCRAQDPGARRARRHDRRSGRAPSRHHRRLDRQQRSGGRLSGRLPGARRDDRHQQAQARRAGFLPRPVRDGARGRRDHHRSDFPDARQGGL